jgi:hypothetical protein
MPAPGIAQCAWRPQLRARAPRHVRGSYRAAVPLLCTTTDVVNVATVRPREARD